MANRSAVTRHYLVASDFDQTLSFNDSGRVLSEIVGIRGLDENGAGLAKANLVQQGAELAYLLRHDTDPRGVRIVWSGAPGMGQNSDRLGYVSTIHPGDGEQGSIGFPACVPRCPAPIEQRLLSRSHVVADFTGPCAAVSRYRLEAYATFARRP